MYKSAAYLVLESLQNISDASSVQLAVVFADITKSNTGIMHVIHKVWP